MLHGAEIDQFVMLAYGFSGGIMLWMLTVTVVAYRRARARLKALDTS
jgi:hypothetical protein